MAINLVNRDDEHGLSSYILSKKKSPISVSDQAGGFLSDIKKPYILM
jgi:hypothetical protein